MPLTRTMSPRKQRFAQRLAEAQTPAQRIAAASDYVRAVAARLPDGEAERVAGEVVQALRRIGDRYDGRPKKTASTRKRRWRPTATRT